MKINSVELIRKIRNNNYEKCKKMSSKEKIKYTKQLAKKILEANKSLKRIANSATA